MEFLWLQWLVAACQEEDCKVECHSAYSLKYMR